MKFLKTILIALLVCSALPAWAATRYVRTADGGTGYDASANPTGQCNGTANVAYPGSGTNQNCAWKNAQWALSLNSSSYPQKISGGDTLIITGDNYVGYLADGSVFQGTSSSYPWDSYFKPVPSGTDSSHKTKIYGANYASCSGRSDTTKLIGKERVQMVLNLEGSDNVELKCLTITDGLDCGEFHGNPARACQRDTYPYGNWGKIGISAVDSENVNLNYVYVEGMAYVGVYAGRLQDWVWDMGDISGNPSAGWDNDRGDPDNWANGGTMTFKGSPTEKFKIQWNGCNNQDPTSPPALSGSCYGQSQSGYGDGFAASDITGALSGADYVFDHVDFSNNVSDGLDLLYKRSKNVTITKSVFAHNAGNQIKIKGKGTINDTKALGDCDFFLGKSYTYTGGAGFDHCRAAGNTISWAVYAAGDYLDIFDSTITGDGDSLIISAGTACNGTERLKVKNSIMVGDTQFGGGDTTDDYYASGDSNGNGDGPCGANTGGLPIDWSSSGSGNIIYATKSNDTGAGISNSNPLLTDKYTDVSIAAGSPARGLRNTSFGGTIDFNGYTRTTAIGALEYGSTSSSASCSNTCSLCSDSGTCSGSAATCYWWSTNTCNTTAEGPICGNTCSQCSNQSTCQASAANCYWWSNSTCNSSAEPSGCSTTCSACANQTNCQASAAGCYWWSNSTCNSTAEGVVVQKNFATVGRCTFSGKAQPR